MNARRLPWLALALAALAVLVTSRLLTPSASGRGTHLALGLPPCGFLAWTGVPCPTCGLTTAFAQLAHGNLAASLRAHPLGLPLFLADIALLLLALRALHAGWSFVERVDRLQADRWAMVVVITLFSTWLARLL